MSITILLQTFVNICFFKQGWNKLLYSKIPHTNLQIDFAKLFLNVL